MPFPSGICWLTGLLPFVPALDVAIEPITRHVAPQAGISPLLVFLPIFAVEALVLWFLRWGNFVRAAVGAFVANAVTTLLGAALRLDYPGERPSHFLLAFLLSFLIEGFILMLLARDRKLLSWLAALAANVISYGLLFVLLVVLTMAGLILQ